MLRLTYILLLHFDTPFNVFRKDMLILYVRIYVEIKWSVIE